MLNALKTLGITILGCCSIFVLGMTVYVLKNIRWESNLKRYKISALGYVQNPQGHLITTPKELLEELQGIEEKIAK